MKVVLVILVSMFFLTCPAYCQTSEQQVEQAIDELAAVTGLDPTDTTEEQKQEIANALADFERAVRNYYQIPMKKSKAKQLGNGFRRIWAGTLQGASYGAMATTQAPYGDYDYINGLPIPEQAASLMQNNMMPATIVTSSGIHTIQPCFGNTYWLH